MARFTLTPAHVTALLDPKAKLAPFLAAIDPDVRWVSASEKKDGARMTGIYNLASWIAEVATPMHTKLTEEGLRLTMSSLDVIGNKAIVEAYGEATQRNGRPYSRTYLKP
ncbi:hypothetical protein DFH09DRAFT_1361748 [Mycena vulgaris]|nr:hypothetical protein DFH09DRAFT_1361748 [Mycena vulgaris]